MVHSPSLTPGHCQSWHSQWVYPGPYHVKQHILTPLFSPSFFILRPWSAFQETIYLHVYLISDCPPLLEDKLLKYQSLFTVMFPHLHQRKQHCNPHINTCWVSAEEMNGSRRKPLWCGDLLSVKWGLRSCHLHRNEDEWADWKHYPKLCCLLFSHYTNECRSLSHLFPLPFSMFPFPLHCLGGFLNTVH